MDGKNIVPVGQRFLPSDTELLLEFLKRKVDDYSFSSEYVVNRMMYGPNANPWEILNKSSTKWRVTNKYEESVYVFTKLIKKATGGVKKRKSGAVTRENYVKKAGCGTWHGETGPLNIMDDKGENVIGSKRLLVFQINDVCGLGNGVDLNMVPYYKMYEYCLCGCDDYVICHITMNKSKKPKIVSLCGKNDGMRSCSKSSSSSSNTGTTVKDDSPKSIAVLDQDSRIVIQGVEEEKIQELVICKDRELGCEKDKYVDDDICWSEQMIEELLQDVYQEEDHDNALEEQQACSQVFEESTSHEVEKSLNLSSESVDDLWLETLLTNMLDQEDDTVQKEQPCSQVFEESTSLEVEKSFNLSSKFVDDLWLEDLFTVDDMIGLQDLYEYYNNNNQQQQQQVLMSDEDCTSSNQVLGKRKLDEHCADQNKKLCI